jgi:beta-galactosidase
MNMFASKRILRMANFCTKGLITFDRKIKKNSFYLYKAIWSKEPVPCLVGRRYTDRAYPVAVVKFFSNADLVQLSVNGKSVGSMPRDEAPLNTSICKQVNLSLGANRVTSVGRHGGKLVSGSVEWSFNTSDLNIAARQ